MYEALRRYRPDLVIPTVSDELAQVAVLADALSARMPRPAHGPSMMVSGPGPTAIAADKLLTMWVLDRAGVAVPRYAPTTDFADAASALAWGEGPVVVKPRISRGGRGVVLVEQPDDLSWTTTTPAQIVQTFAGGTEYSPQLYRSPADDRCTVVVLEKTELKEGRVGNAVSTVRVDGDEVADVVAAAEATAAALDLNRPDRHGHPARRRRHPGGAGGELTVRRELGERPGTVGGRARRVAGLARGGRAHRDRTGIRRDGAGLRSDPDRPGSVRARL